MTEQKGSITYLREKELPEGEIKIEVGADSKGEVVNLLTKGLGLKRGQLQLGNRSYRVRGSLLSQRQDSARMILHAESRWLIGALIKVGQPKYTGYEPDCVGFFESTGPNKYYGVALVDTQHNPIYRTEAEFRKMTIA